MKHCGGFVFEILVNNTFVKRIAVPSRVIFLRFLKYAQWQGSQMDPAINGDMLWETAELFQ